MNANTTTRNAATTILNQLRNVNNRIAVLTVKRINQSISPAETAELSRLYEKAKKLNQEETAARYFEQTKTTGVH